MCLVSDRPPSHCPQLQDLFLSVSKRPHDTVEEAGALELDQDLNPSPSGKLPNCLHLHCFPLNNGDNNSYLKVIDRVAGSKLMYEK